MKTYLLALMVCFSAYLPGFSAELIMVEQPGCPWCTRFNAEIAPAYANAEEGAYAPLRRVDISKGWPKDLAHVAPERMTPSFILIESGLEVARMRGYPGDEFFWFLLDDMLDKTGDWRSISTSN